MLEHYVVFKTRPGQEDQFDAACAELAAELGEGIEGLQAFSWGRNTNQSGLARGFTHGCLGRFSDKDAFRRYWDHPAHVAFMSALDKLCEDRFALDYETVEDR